MTAPPPPTTTTTNLFFFSFFFLIAAVPVARLPEVVGGDADGGGSVDGAEEAAEANIL